MMPDRTPSNLTEMTDAEVIVVARMGASITRAFPEGVNAERCADVLKELADRLERCNDYLEQVDDLPRPI